jgi:hypothetical protein
VRGAHGQSRAHAKYLQSQMGHSSIQVTLDKYGHLFPDANRGVLAALDELVRGDGARMVPADEMAPKRPRRKSLLCRPFPEWS